MNAARLGRRTLVPIMLGLMIVARAGLAYGVEPSFHGLGDLPGGGNSSSGLGVSANGTVAVGSSRSSQEDEAFRWTASEGMVAIGSLDGGRFRQPMGVSADGSVIVGWGVKSHWSDIAVRWTQTGGAAVLPGPAGEETRGYAVSADGSVVAGVILRESVWEAFRWEAVQGMTPLGFLPGGNTFSLPLAMSGDGSIVVGAGGRPGVHAEAFRWTSATGMVGMGDLPGGEFDSYAYGISADGKVIVGRGYSDLGNEAFRWTAETGMVGLGDLPGGLFTSLAHATSGDGSIIVGFGNTPAGREAFIWDATNGMRNLKQVLSNEYGLDLTDWQLTEAYGVSANGGIIVGSGINPLGDAEGWIATLPEPATLSLLALGFLALLRSRR